MEWYEAEVQALERSLLRRVDGSRPPVFYGSSSIRLWDTLAEDFDARVVNLGFGGSTIEACDYFFERLVVPVRPRSLLVYAGDNDLGDGRSVAQILGWLRSMLEKTDRFIGDIPFGFVSIKPSPARIAIIDRIRSLNELARREIAARPAAYFVDVYPAMIDRNGNPRPEYFLDDGLHLSREGYRLWRQFLEPHRNQIFTCPKLY